MWMNVQINGETAGSHLSKDMHGEPVIAPEYHADILETVTVENGDPGGVTCSVCDENFEDESDAEGQECPEAANLCTDPECPCDDSTDHPPVHTIKDTSLSWFTEARIGVSEEDDSVRVNISTGASTLEMTMARLDSGEIVLYLPETDSRILRPHAHGYLVVNP